MAGFFHSVDTPVWVGYLVVAGGMLGEFKRINQGMEYIIHGRRAEFESTKETWSHPPTEKVPEAEGLIQLRE